MSDQLTRIWPAVGEAGGAREVSGAPAAGGVAEAGEARGAGDLGTSGDASSRDATLSDEELVRDLLADSSILRVNFVASLNGSTTHDGRSGGLSGEADKRYFELLRRVCDVVLVGAGTVRDEGYGPMMLSEESANWRLGQGRPAHPVFAIVSRKLDLDPESSIFSEAPVRPIVVTTASAPAESRTELERVADVLISGESEVDFARLRSELESRGLNSILCEGGPQLFGAMLRAGVVDELCLTVSPLLEPGAPFRLVGGLLPEPTRLKLKSALVGADGLLLRYST